MASKMSAGLTNTAHFSTGKSLVGNFNFQRSFVHFSSSSIRSQNSVVNLREGKIWGAGKGDKGVSRNARIMAVKVGLATLTLQDTFVKLKEQGKVAFIPYLTAGDPDLRTTGEAMKLLDSCGADILELGVPYSDPLADGPVIQAAATRALNNGTNLDKVFELMHEVVPDLVSPVVVFVYYNQVLKRGVEKFMEDAKAAGAVGLVVPDLPLEESSLVRKSAVAAGLELVLLTTPTTPNKRMEIIAQKTAGFLYLVSLTGVTGVRSEVHSRVQSLLQNIKQVTEKPVAVGFGISSPEQAAQVAEWGADGVIIGSAIVRILGESDSPENGLSALKVFAGGIKRALS